MLVESTRSRGAHSNEQQQQHLQQLVDRFCSFVLSAEHFKGLITALKVMEHYLSFNIDLMGGNVTAHTRHYRTKGFLARTV